MNFLEFYHSLTLWIGKVSGLPDSILHMHAGLAVLLAARFMSRRPLGSFIPFLFVVLAEGLNEISDYFTNGWHATDTVSDVVNTLFWPFVISLAILLRPVARQYSQRDAGICVSDGVGAVFDRSDARGELN